MSPFQARPRNLAATRVSILRMPQSHHSSHCKIRSFMSMKVHHPDFETPSCPERGCSYVLAGMLSQFGWPDIDWPDNSLYRVRMRYASPN
jgi:hypothetical protein